ncbi:MAG: glycosyltransferase family 39 protein [Bacteroidota bacterium]|nr:glycosyltransferase family 39 protein [Bacteroidota bacterium]MDP4250048.1 glycosyltransferase family 39 protein [Bacteroidota bacterium]
MQKANRLLYLLALVKLILPFFLQHPIYEPHRDEFLYLAEGNHLAFGYMEAPPLLSIFAWLTHLFGDGMFWIKIWPSLFGALNFILSGKIALSLGGKTFSVFLLFLSFFFSAFLRVHFLFQPNFLEIFFYTMIAIGLIRYMQTSKNKWLYLTGMSAGLGLLSKYSVAFYIIALAIGLLLTPQRKIFLNKHLYAALGITALLFLPNFVWQYTHHFPVIFHMNELRERQLQYVPPASFLKDQVLMFFPCCMVWIAGLIFLLTNRTVRPFLFLAWAYLAVIGMLLWFQGKNYYALGLYPVLLAFGSYALENWTSRRRLYFLRYVITLWAFAFGLYFVSIGLPLLKPTGLASFYRKMNTAGTGALRWEDHRNHPLPQDFADMLGWEEMAGKTGEAYNSLSEAEKKQTLVFCDNYGMAGAVNFYRCKYQLPEAYSDNASFLYWLPDHFTMQNLLLVTDDTAEMHHAFIKDFASARVYDSISNPYAREKGDLIIILKGANEQFRKMFEEKILTDKSKIDN